MWCASSSKTSIKVPPIAFLFPSGSEIPANLSKKRFDASTPLTFKPMPSYCFKTLSNSFLRNNPLLTKIQYKFFPIALCNKTAATVESTPPESPKTTLSFPTFSLIAATVLSTKESGVHVCPTLAMFTKKFANNCFPSFVWYTSGWNWMANVSSPSILYAAFSTSFVLANKRPLVGNSLIVSEWLIQTWLPTEIFWKKISSSFTNDKFALPYSLVLDGATLPPEKCAKYCAP